MMLRLLMGLGLVLLALPAEGAITRANVSATQCAGTSCAVDHSVAAANLEALVCVNWFATGSRTVTSLSVGAGSAALVDRAQNGSCGGGQCGAELWHVTNPATGVQSVSATLSGSTQVVLGVMTYAGVDATTPLGTAVPGSGNSASPSVGTTTAAGDVVSGCLSIINAGSSPSLTGGTGAYSNYDPGGFIHGAGGELTAAGTATPFPWTYGSAQAYALLAVPLKAAGSGGGGGLSSERLVWTDLSSGQRQETNTRVYWKHTTQPTYQLIATLAPDSTTHTVTYTTETERCYVVDQINSAGTSPLSNELCTTITAPGPIRETLTAPSLAGGLSDY